MQRAKPIFLVSLKLREGVFQMLRLFYQGLWVIRLEPSQGINPVLPDISMPILHTVLYKFPKV